MLNELKNEDDKEMFSLIETENVEIKKELEELEINILLNGPYDKLNAVLELHSGAGGTEAGRAGAPG